MNKIDDIFTLEKLKHRFVRGHRDYTSHYQHCQEIILTNEKNYTANLEDLTEYLQLLNETGPPQHVWSNLTPSVEANRIQDTILMVMSN